MDKVDGSGVVGTLWVGAELLALASAATKLPASEMTPAGYRQSPSVYVKMRDGVEIAVTILLPADLKAGEHVPVLMRTAVLADKTNSVF